MITAVKQGGVAKSATARENMRNPLSLHSQGVSSTPKAVQILSWFPFAVSISMRW